MSLAGIALQTARIAGKLQGGGYTGKGSTRGFATLSPSQRVLH
jgi:hypothetical protein